MVRKMAMIAVWQKVADESVVQSLEEAEKQLDTVDGEMALDFSSVRRIDSEALRAMEGFAALADYKNVKLDLRGVGIGVYKVLKLMKLTSRFSFVN
jgi:anti-anti-sigma regulatory factor